MKVMFVSTSVETLNMNRIQTSSAKFELQLALNLVINHALEVIICSTRLEYGVEESGDNVRLIGINTGRINNYYQIKKIINKMKIQPDFIIFYGYDLERIVNLLYIRQIFEIPTLPFIFDTHKPSLDTMNYFKRIAVSLYFNVAILLLDFFDSYILFQEDAAKELSLSKKYVVLSPGINKNEVSNYIYEGHQDIFTVTYLGSLMKYNGIKTMLHSFQKLDDQNIRFRIFGAGQMENELIKYASQDSRVYYGGLINQSEVKKEIEKSDLLLNLRDPSDYVNKFAFPSKLVESMSTGVPVLSTDLGFDEEMKQALYIINELDSTKLKRKIQAVKSDNLINKKKKTGLAKKYVLENNNWNTITNKLVQHLKI